MVVPMSTWRISPQLICRSSFVESRSMREWPREPLRQSLRWSKRSSPQSPGRICVKVMWSCVLMRPGEIALPGQVITVALLYEGASAQSQPAHSMKPEPSTMTSPPT